ncbi:VOC family protein [Cupriavidus necator]
MTSTPKQDAGAARVAPFKMAHLVIRTARYAEMVQWYRTIMLADIVFANESLSFITFDDEHHRAAIVNVPELAQKPAGIVGIDHVAYSYRDLSELLCTYVRLKDAGILPFWCINHGVTTSIYYHDPENNDVELQVDNYPDPKDAVAYFHSDAFANNPIGVEFDPDVMVELWRGGMPDAALSKQGTAASRQADGGH